MIIQAQHYTNGMIFPKQANRIMLIRCIFHDHLHNILA